ncbi:MAG: glycosyltransferase family 39 protein [Alphaproteobacteria bacterium]|nr:glycosyltransferase family 39 protein [Alphaproteobacteria bacterium]
MNSRHAFVAAIAVLLAARAAMAWFLPLSADEAYYWLWSKHLAAGYYDHPPAIAWAIAAGTHLLGDTAIGVRLAGVILSIPVTWLVWDSARLLLKDRAKAWLAAIIFNMTLMASVEMLAATPDMPSIVTSAAMLWTLARLRENGQGRCWIGFGIAAGLGLLSKFSALFLGLGALIWLLADRQQRRWLATPWPWMGAVLAVAIFAPNLWWQSQHQWETFAFQFGRVDHGRLTGRFLGEFLGAQAGLASPLVFVLMLLGLWAGRKPGTALFLPALLAFTAIAYFLVHALHARVQGNWPCFLYPMLSVLAAAAFSLQGARWRRWLSLAALPLAALLLLAAYAQAGWGVVPIPNDPAARILGRQFRPVATVAAALSQAHLADAIVTTDYETTAWLRFYEPAVKVIQVNEPWRYPQAPAPSEALLKGRLIYLASFKRDQHHLVEKYFAYTGFPTQIQGAGQPYMLYPMGKPKHFDFGKMP